jgi:hypothetical protein
MDTGRSIAVKPNARENQSASLLWAVADDWPVKLPIAIRPLALIPILEQLTTEDAPLTHSFCSTTSNNPDSGIHLDLSKAK